MKYVIGALLLAASLMLASTSGTQAQSSSIWPWNWNWGMGECKSGYKYDASRNVCVAEKKGKKRKVAKRSAKSKKKA